MTDAERDQIDADAQTFMRTCSEAIRVFRSEGKGIHSLILLQQDKTRCLSHERTCK